MARAILQGIAVSSGIAVGRGFFFNRRPQSVPHELVPLEHVEKEAARFEAAAAETLADFEDARRGLSKNLPEQNLVLESHLLICNDPKLRGETRRRILEQRMNAEWALEESVARIAEAFSRLSSPYIRDRIQDVRVVAAHLSRRLGTPRAVKADETDLWNPAAGNRDHGGLHGDERRRRLRDGEPNEIMLANDISPADANCLRPENTAAFATAEGGKTSHTGILARNLRIPAVVGVSGLEDEIRPGDLLIIDGLSGMILVEPSESELAEYRERKEQFAAYQARISENASGPAETEDGCRITVLANIEKAAEAEAVLASGSEGVGLVRTEFGYLSRPDLPTEEELYAEYAALASAVAPRKVVFRTLDVGADKIFSERRNLDETNPALGMRGIRYCLRHPDIFRTQLRAILRAGAHGACALMFPLISSITELRQAKALLNEAKQELDNSGIPFDSRMPVGIMIELPSAVFTAEALARESDFFSIGTNDLIQYTLGIDRANKHVAYLHQPLHPAIIRAIKLVVDMAHKAGISVSICGEMAADPYCLPILIGLGLDELSVAPHSAPAIKHLIRRCSREESRELLQQTLAAPTVRAINEIVRQAVYGRFPEDLSFFISQLDADG